MYMLMVLIFDFAQPLTLNSNTAKINSSHVEEILDQVFENYSSLVVVAPNTSFARELVPELDFPVEVYNEDYILELCYDQPTQSALSGYVIVSENLESRHELLECIRNTVVFPADTDFVIIHKPQVTVDIQDIYLRYLARLWDQLSLVKVLIVSISGNNFPRVYAYNPFNNIYKYTISCNLYECFKRTNVIFRSTSLMNLTGVSNIPINMSLRFKQMNGYSIDMLFFDYGDRQNVYLKFNTALTHFLKVSLFFLPLRFATYLNSNGKVIRNMSSHNIEAVVFRKPVFNFPFSKFKFKHLFPTEEYPVGFLMRKPSPMKSWMIFLYIFEPSLMMAIVFTFLSLNLAFVLLKVAGYENPDSKLKDLIYRSGLMVCKTILSIGLPKLPSSHSERILLACCFSFGLVITTLFSGQIFVLITSKLRPLQLDTIQQIVDSQLSIVTRSKKVDARYLEDSLSNKLVPRLVEDVKGVNELYLYGNFNVVQHRPVMIYFFNEVTTLAKNKRPDLYLAKETLAKLHFTYLRSFNWSRFDNYFNLFILIAIQHGHILKWTDEELTSQSKHRPNITSRSSLSEYLGKGVWDVSESALTYDMLLLPFYILYAGCLISSMLFVIEITTQKLIIRYNNRRVIQIQ